MHVSLIEVETLWSTDDVAMALGVLDACDDAESRANAKARG